MFPNVARIHITKSAREVTDIVSSNCQFEQYLLDLYTKYFDAYTALNLHGSWQGGFTKMYSVVTTMRLFFGDYSEQMFQLIHNCAHSLESLAVHNYRGREAYSIFMDTNDSPVEYTRLRSLKLSMVKSSGTVSRGSGVTVLLPSLTHLDVDGSYAFEDDVLFRATRKTLKYANILVDLHTAAILEKYNVFRDPDYLSICHVKISRISDADDDTRRAGHWAYVSSIACNLKALTVYPSSTLATLVESLSNGPEIQSIQHLTLDSATLVFSSVCCLVQKLPQMSRLTLASVYLDKQYLDMDRYEMHDYVVGKWGVLSSQLRLFHVSIDMCKYDLATCAVLLATVCPGLTCFTSSMRSVDSIYELIVWTAKGEPFSRYTERLERIGFDGVPEGCEVFTAQLAC
ncbi:hypothetical protein GGI06_001841 [Coemansia sp. S85]|nr:hypothetical protein GGI06_001841 [Coemansia sp. S85]